MDILALVPFTDRTSTNDGIFLYPNPPNTISTLSTPPVEDLEVVVYSKSPSLKVYESDSGLVHNAILKVVLPTPDIAYVPE